MLIHTNVGPTVTDGSIRDGIQVPQRSGQLGESIIGNLHGRYYETTYRGNLFLGASDSPTQLTTGNLSTTYRGLCLSNPIASPVNLSILKVGYAFTLQPTNAFAIGLMCGYDSDLNVVHSIVGRSLSGALLCLISGCVLAYGQIGEPDTITTLNATPFVTHILGSVTTGATTTNTSYASKNFDMDGALLIPPGGYVAFYSSAENTLSGFMGSFFAGKKSQYEE